MRIFHTASKGRISHRLPQFPLLCEIKQAKRDLSISRFLSLSSKQISNKKEGPHHFFKAVEKYQSAPISIDSMISFLSNEEKLTAVLNQICPQMINSYLFGHFIRFTSTYVNQSPSTLIDYFLGQKNLNKLSYDFINFCFSQKIDLDPGKTLDSFNYHNKLSDRAVKKELSKIQDRDTINLLGFGLDEGDYEKSVAQFLLDQNKANTVNIYGFDPYAKQSSGIQYLLMDQIRDMPSFFDLVIARWVLHHVALTHRWSEFTQCLNCCSSDANVLIVEHGFLEAKPDSLIEAKLYHSLNAFFDVVANIGLRPRYFTDSAPHIGARFFLHYLEPEDFNAIVKNLTFETNRYDVGPNFPNQTICSMSRTSV